MDNKDEEILCLFSIKFYDEPGTERRAMSDVEF